ncbi:MAG: hypothetical protein ABI600_16830 [Luteolibacter sp.]
MAPAQTKHLLNTCYLGPHRLIRSHDQFRFQITLRSLHARPLTRRVQAALTKTQLTENVTVVFDMDALNFS